MSHVKVIVISFVATAVLALGAFLVLQFLSGGPARESTAPLAETASSGTPESTPRAPAALRDPERVPSPADRSVEPPADDGSTPRSSGGQGGVLEGRVVDGKNRGVAGAEVELAQGPALVVAMPDLRTATGLLAQTDQSGAFRIEGLGPADDYLLVARHADYGETVSGPFRLGAGERQTVPDIMLEQGLRVYGFVGSGGRPISGATVTLESTMTGLFGPKREAERGQVFKVTTRNDGTFEFEAVAIKNFQVTAEAEGFGRVTMTNRNFLAAPEDQQLNFDLTPEMTISGVVIDQNGAPLREVQVTASLSGETYRSESLGTSHADGSFQLGKLVKGAYHVTASAEGYSPSTKPRVEAGTTGVELSLLPQGSIAGRVVDERTGGPISDFEILVLRSFDGRDPTHTGVSRSFRDSKGVFEIGGLDPNNYVVEARARGYAACQAEPCTVTRGNVTSDVVVSMNAGGSVEGTIVDANGAGIPGALVTLNPNNFKWNPVHDILDRMAGANTTTQRVRTAEDGSFRIDLIVPEVYQVSAKHPDFAAVEINDLAVVKNETTSLGKVPLPAGGIVDGHTFDENGGVLPGATVSATSADGDYATGTSDNQGYFRITGLRPGEYSVQINNFASTKQENILVQMLMAKNSQVKVALNEGGYQTVELRLTRQN